MEYHQQPGLEVSPNHNNPNFPGLEVVPDQQFHQDPHGGTAYYPVQQQVPLQQVPLQQYQDKQASPSLPPSYPPSAPAKSRKRLWWIILGVVAIVAVIIGAVVGGVLGSRAANNSGGDGGSPSNKTLKSIRHNSKLAVTGYRGNGDFHIRLFYQGPDNVLRYSDYWSVTDNWSKPVPLDDLSPMANTPIASGTWLNVSPPRVHLYYLDEASVLRGQKFRDGFTPAGGQSTDINSYPMTIDRSSRLSGYHPHIVSQDSDGKIRWIHWSDPGVWNNYTFDDASVAGSPNSGLVALVASVDFLNTGAFMYRSKAGRIKSYIGSTNGSISNDWAWSYGTPNTPIPADTAIGAFVYAREADLINTYAMYQDDDGALQVIWQNDTKAWQGPKTYPALDGADKGTDIACLTQAAWDQAHINISDATDMNRCYFQSGGQLMEVRFDGTEWKKLGAIAMP